MTTTTTKIDVREYPEYAAGHIEDSKLVSLASLPQAATGWDRQQPLLLICESGRRAELARQQLTNLGFTALTVLDGGIDGWSAASKPLISLPRAPWSMERQVRIAAGSLVVLTLALARFISPYFLLGTALIGAGLVFAGVSNTCMMGNVLQKFPWNRPRQPLTSGLH